MSKTALPTASDVAALLLNLPNPITLPSGFDTASEVASAVEDWNRRTGYRPFFQSSSTPVAVSFDPPGPDNRQLGRGGSSRLLLKNGILAVTSVFLAVNQPSGDVGYQLVQGQDFWPYPSDAMTPMKAIPWTRIDFASTVRGLPQSVVVTGVWGYCQGVIPDDAWAAIRDLAAARCLEDVLQGVSLGEISLSDIRQSLSFSPDLIKALGGSLQRRAETVLYRYRLFS